MPQPHQTASWTALQHHAKTMQATPLTSLFDQDPERFDRYHITTDSILFDYSKNHITSETIALLCDLAKTQNLLSWRDLMFSGDAINTSENRAVLHTALRRPVTDTVMVGTENVMPFVGACLDKMRDFSDKVRNGEWRGHTGKPITDIVNIGIGGSDLGPVAAASALAPYAQPNLHVHFVSNVDGAHLSSVLAPLDPEHTLFLIASKTFTTQETMANAASARTWILNAFHGDNLAIAKHFVALSTNEAGVTAFGILPDNMFPYRDWVGGRYSVWSSIGLSLCLSIGFDGFQEFLKGAYAADQHFQTAPLERNIPVLMALLGIWYTNFWGATTHAVLPYDQRLHRFPAYLQQLDMESNGKSVDRDGHAVPYATGPIIFGEAGTNGQHSFYQLIHQGTHIIPCDFVAVKHPHHAVQGHHDLLLANALAQPQALMRGQTLAEANGDPARVFTGNRPSNVLLLGTLDPYRFGFLLALYEHKVFTQGIIWNLNSFDQPGVELGKTLANQLLQNGKLTDHPSSDSSTRGLTQAILKRTPA